MMKIKRLILFVLSVASFVSVCYFNRTTSFAEGNSAEIVMELDSNRVLYSKNERNKMYMASTTKILSAILVIENMNMSDTITITDKTINVEGSSIYLEKGEKLSVKDLLFGLMLRSGNDCAETLAVACSGSIEKFAELMNEKAVEIGVENSHFTNPHGLHDDNHYTTAYDLALISCYAMKNDVFREIVGTKSITIPHTTRDYDRLLINKNKMLKEFDGTTGIKTGYTKKAGRCLVTSCVRNGMELICVVLNCPPMFEKSKELLAECFNNFSLYNLVESDNIIGFISDKNNKKFAICVKNDLILPLKECERDKISIVYNYPNKVNFEIINEQEIGSIQIFNEKDLLFEQKIYTIL